MIRRSSSPRPAGRIAVPPAGLVPAGLASVAAAAVRRAGRDAAWLPAVLLGLPALVPLLRSGAVRWLEYDRGRIAAGEPWRIVTCHWTHWTGDHLAWDLAVFVLLAALCWRLGRARTLAALAAAAVLIPPALAWLMPELGRYRGLSGLDSALFVLLAGALIRRERSAGRTGGARLLTALLLAFGAKVAFEAVTGTTLFVDPSADFVPVPLAHLVGGVCGGVAVALPWTRRDVAFQAATAYTRSESDGRPGGIDMNGAAEASIEPAAAAAEPFAGRRPDAAASPRRWSVAERIAFRFVAVYFVLYAFPFPLDALPWLGEHAERAVGWVWKQAAQWVGAHLLGISEMQVAFTGSGDTTYDYVRLLLTLVLAMLLAALWSGLDRRRAGYAPAARWLVVAVRFYLGFALVTYGLYKVVPVQFTSPSLARLVTPYGEFSPMGVVWSFMGSSPAYTIFTGAGELVAGLLLFWHRTRILGAAIATAVIAQVVALNFTYDVPVKLFSSHLLLVALVLLWVERERLLAVCWRHCALPAVSEQPLFRGRRARRVATAATALFVGSVLVAGAHEAVTNYRLYGDGRERSSLWGIHDVERFVADGEELPPLLTDELRWRALVVDRELPIEVAGQRWPGTVSIQRMDGSLMRIAVLLDEAARTLTFLPQGATGADDAEPRGLLAWERPLDGRLILRGT